jgi:hypothetical protein
VAGNHLSRLCLGAEGHVGAGPDGAQWVTSDDVRHLVVVAREHDVLPGHIVLRRKVLQPLIREVIPTDDSGVGVGPLPEVQLSVRPDNGVVALVVASPRKPGDQVFQPPV